MYTILFCKDGFELHIKNILLKTKQQFEHKKNQDSFRVLVTFDKLCEQFLTNLVQAEQQKYCPRVALERLQLTKNELLTKRQNSNLDADVTLAVCEHLQEFLNDANRQIRDKELSKASTFKAFAAIWQGECERYLPFLPLGLEARLALIFLKQQNDGHKRFQNSSYYGNTGREVLSALAIAEPIFCVPLNCQDLEQWLYNQLQQLWHSSRTLEDDEEGYGRATMIEIFHDIQDLLFELKQSLLTHKNLTEVSYKQQMPLLSD